jgi:alanine-glyoxylate transaminase/serine-glyoxylate transaminase/serine-pyruvate transaminase
MTVHTGRHFLQIPGPTNVPADRCCARWTCRPWTTGVEFAEISHAVLAAMQRVFRTKQPVIIYRRPAPGLGGRPRQHAAARRQGADGGSWAVRHSVARHRRKFKVDVDFLPGDWRHGADLEQIEAKLSADKAHKIKSRVRGP